MIRISERVCESEWCRHDSRLKSGPLWPHFPGSFLSFHKDTTSAEGGGRRVARFPHHSRAVQQPLQSVEKETAGRSRSFCVRFPMAVYLRSKASTTAGAPNEVGHSRSLALVFVIATGNPASSSLKAANRNKLGNEIVHIDHSGKRV